MNEYRQLMESLDTIEEGSDTPPNANYGDVEVSIAGHRAQQDSNGTHKLKVWMSNHDSKQMRGHGDGYVYQVRGVSLEELTSLVNQWYRGKMQNIEVRPPAAPRPMHKVGMNWAYMESVDEIDEGRMFNHTGEMLRALLNDINRVRGNITHEIEELEDWPSIVALNNVSDELNDLVEYYKTAEIKQRKM